ncbi:hypothetical protein KC19_VG116200 [Ceratodon purpureus]|uniref:Tubulin-specific chaperone A n=1 Tax=Ceratodon purpureus TaxID=3225 RepID=A0A8T0HPC0_CERPU|nr:hypothetical protein KC19_VG116200 [Ceratodon purpureus]
MKTTSQHGRPRAGMDESTLKSLKVKMGVCKRVMKELHSYEQEVEREFAKTENMKNAQACPFDIKQQENVLAESYMMIPNCQRRLDAALATLVKAVSECEALTIPDDCEELSAATRLIAQVKPIFADLPS